MKFRQQRGYVLLVLMALVLSAGAGIFVTGISKSVVERKASHDGQVVTQLKNIRQRLLTYAAIVPDLYGSAVGPGYLPCPTLKKDAEAESGCYGGTVQTGWLPRKITGADISFEAEGLEWERVWFVLDTRYALRTNAAGCGGLPLSSSTGRCTPLNTAIDADRIELNQRTGIVGLLIYAGNGLSGQRRDPLNPAIKDYLDAENGDGDTQFVSTQADDPFNDIVVPIYQHEWARVMRNRVIYTAKAENLCAGGVSGFDWFGTNQWNETAQKVCL